MRIQRLVWCVLAGLALVRSGAAQDNVIAPDLTKIHEEKAWRLVNAQARVLDDVGRPFVRLEPTARPERNSSNAGLALVEGLKFKAGTIELDLKGRNQRQGSFLGVAFHAIDNKTMEGVYFRPFNFHADPPFRNRAVQYIAWPEHTWQKLREKSPGVYENAVHPVPDPDGWFHARIEVTAKTVTVFVNDDKTPSLTVNRLTGRDVGGVGLWADIFEGSFRNLRVTPR